MSQPLNDFAPVGRVVAIGDPVTAIGAAVILSTAALLMACNNGDNTPAGACAGYCEHFLVCNGFTESAASGPCQQRCSDGGFDTTVFPFTCNADADVIVSYFKCAENVPCSDLHFFRDAASDALGSCMSQVHCP